MITWFIVGGFLVGCLWGWKKVAWWIASDLGGDGEAIVGGLVLGLLGCWLWPAFLVGVVIRTIFNNNTEAIFKLLMPRNEKKKLELQAREDRIRELEFELNIRDTSRQRYNKQGRPL